MVKLWNAILLANVAAHVSASSRQVGPWGVKPRQSTAIESVVLSIPAGGSDSSSLDSAKSAALQSASEKVCLDYMDRFVSSPLCHVQPCKCF